MSKKAKFIEEFVITAGKGMKRKAIRKAFQNLSEYGIGTFASVSVLSKQIFIETILEFQFRYGMIISN